MEVSSVACNWFLPSTIVIALYILVVDLLTFMVPEPIQNKLLRHAEIAVTDVGMKSLTQ